MLRIGRCFLLLFIVIAKLSSFAQGQQEPTAPSPVAKIDSQPVSKAEVDLEFRRAYGERQFTDVQRAAAWRAALEQVIDRRLVLAYLERTKQAASSQDVDLAQAQLEKDLKAQDLTMDEHLQAVGLSLDDIRRALAWKLSWNEYLKRHVTDANLQKYFELHPREFDGAQLRVAHILLKLAADADEQAIAAAQAKAASIRQEIVAGQLSFADAAKAHSQSPTAKGGGDLGWIERHQPMPEAFSRAAFALDKGQFSEPVVSPFGVHLITVTDIKPGQKTWQDAAAELRPAVTIYLFRWLADKERAKAKVEYVAPDQ